MKIGKVPESVLKRSVIRQLHTKRKEVVLGAGVGEDCAALTLAPDEMFVMSTDPITGTIHEIGKLAILITTNDLASAGAEPIGVMLTILLPEHTEESLLKQLMQELEEAGGVRSDYGRTYRDYQGGKSATGYCMRCRKSKEERTHFYRRSKTGHGHHCH